MKLDLATLRTVDAGLLKERVSGLRRIDRAAIKKRLQACSVVALTLEAGQMTVGVVRSEGSDGRRVTPFTVPVGAEEVFRNPEKAGQALAAALEAAGVREKRCVVCVPPDWALSASTELPAVSTEDLRGYLELRAEREFSLPPGEMRLAFCPYDLPGGQRRATLAAITSKRLQAVEKMAQAAGRQAVSVSLALDGALADARPRLRFHADGGHTDVIVTAGGGVAALRSLPGPPAGEPAKGTPAFNPAAFCREIRITLGRLPAAVREQVREVTFNGEPAAARILHDETRPFLERMGITVAEVDARLKEEPARAALGTAARHLRGEPVAFEFLVPVPNRWEGVLRWFGVRRNRRLALAGVGLILLPVVLFFIRSQIESHLQTRWEAMRDNVAELDTLQQKIRRFRPWFDPAPQNLQVLEDLITVFPEAGDVWAKSIQIGTGYKVTCAGFARNQPALITLLTRLRARPDVSGVQLQQTRGDNPIQFLFTYKWEGRREK